MTELALRPYQPREMWWPQVSISEPLLLGDSVICILSCCCCSCCHRRRQSSRSVSVIPKAKQQSKPQRLKLLEASYLRGESKWNNNLHKYKRLKGIVLCCNLIRLAHECDSASPARLIEMSRTEVAIRWKFWWHRNCREKSRGRLFFEIKKNNNKWKQKCN